MIRRFVRLLEVLGSPWPLAVEPSEELQRAVQFLGLDEADAIVAGGYVGGLIVWLLSTAVAIALSVPLVPPSSFSLLSPLPSLPPLPPLPPLAALTLPFALGLGWVHVAHRLPVWVGTFHRTRALGAVATVVGLAALRLRLTPSPERAASFTARSGTGPLSESLARHVAAARGTPRSGLSTFAAAWRPWFPALDRATSLLVAASEASSDGRRRALDRAVATVGENVESRAASFAETVRGPVTGLYALGVLLPLALVGAVPAAAVAGVPITPAVFVVVYDGLLPFGVAVGGARIVLGRPVAFPPPSVPSDHPELPDRRALVVATGLAVGGAGWLLSGVAVAAWARPLGAVGAGVGSSLVVALRPATVLRERVRKLERGLPDALALVGRRVAGGETVESALGDVGRALPDPVGGAFETAARRRETLRVGIERAFCGDHGPFVHTPTARGRGVATLLAVAAREGRPAGAVLVDEAERLDTLRDHEQTARRQIASITGTLSNTAAVFGPLVGGATVALAGRLDGLDATAAAGSGSALSPATLGAAVGVYVLLLAVLLPTLATALQYGFDRTLVGYRAGQTLLAATATFLLGVWATGLLV